jgi:integrase
MRIALTDLFVKSAKPQPGKPQTDYFDATVSGLALRVTASAKSWSLMTTGSNGKRQRRTLGRYPVMPLAVARTAALEAKQGNGSGQTTVADALVMFLKAKERRSYAELKRRLDKNVVPVIGAVRLVELTRADAAKVIAAVKDRGAPVEALRVAEDLRAFGRWTVGAGLLDRDPLAGMLLPAKSKPRERVLSDDECQTVWRGLDTIRADFATATRLLLVTGQRRGEVVGMRRDELDLKVRIWTLPGERVKNGRKHVVPLSDLAVELIRAALEAAGDSPRVFPTIPSADCLTVRINAKQFGLERWTVHDLRRTALTKMQELGTSPVVLGAIANHKGGGVTLTHYAYYDYGPEKRRALDLWADRLRAIMVNADAAKIVSLVASA